MPRPRSVYERQTKATTPPPERSERTHLVRRREGLLLIANVEYSGEEYNPDSWRLVGSSNSVLDPFKFNDLNIGKKIKIPAPPLPDFS